MLRTALASTVFFLGFLGAALLSPNALCDGDSAAPLPEGDVEYLAAAKSPNRAFLLSAALPGAGQLYAGAKRGAVYLAAEAGLLIGYAVARRSAQQLRGDYFNLVRAGVTFDGPGSTDRWNDEDFEHATDFNTWDNVYVNDGGVPIERVGAYYWRDIDEETPDSQLRAAALEKRLESNDRYRDARTVLGALLFNHLISAVDARFAARKHNSGLSAQMREYGGFSVAYTASF